MLGYKGPRQVHVAVHIMLKIPSFCFHCIVVDSSLLASNQAAVDKNINDIHWPRSMVGGRGFEVGNSAISHTCWIIDDSIWLAMNTEK